MKGNYLTIGNLSYLYSALKDSEKNTIAKYYSEKYNKQYKPSSHLRISSRDMESALKIFNLIRNQCAHSYCTWYTYSQSPRFISSAVPSFQSQQLRKYSASVFKSFPHLAAAQSLNRIVFVIADINGFWHNLKIPCQIAFFSFPVYISYIQTVHLHQYHSLGRM